MGTVGKRVGLLVNSCIFLSFVSWKKKYLYQLAEFVLSRDVLRYFSIARIETSSTSFRFHIDENPEKELYADVYFESKRGVWMPWK